MILVTKSQRIGINSEWATVINDNDIFVRKNCNTVRAKIAVTLLFSENLENEHDSLRFYTDLYNNVGKIYGTSRNNFSVDNYYDYESTVRQYFNKRMNNGSFERYLLGYRNSWKSRDLAIEILDNYFKFI